MALTANNSKKQFPPIEAGTHQAVCFGIIDLGTQENEWNNETKDVHQILILWEIPSLTYEIDDKGAKKILTKTISKTYTLSLGEKAKLRADLTSWRGVPFTEDELERFDVFNVLGANCILQIIHVKKGDKTYANISSVMALMKGMPSLKPVRPTVKYSMEESGCLLPDGIPDWIVTKIKSSKEYQSETSMHDESQESDGSPEWNGPTEEPEDKPPF
jgi:hypothetical protein